MTPRLYVHIKDFWINLGWFSGEEFALFSLETFKVFLDSKNELDMITLFDIQIAKFGFCFGINF
jgi:hypothetical protein